MTTTASLHMGERDDVDWSEATADWSPRQGHESRVATDNAKLF